MVKSRNRRTRKRKMKKQKGGVVELFQVYVFTKRPIPEEEKQTLYAVLQNLYGDDVSEIVDSSSFPNDYLKEDIKNFVYDKKGHYPRLKTLTGFSIPVPTRLNAGNMNDPKLTKEEYAIRDTLLVFEAPFKLVDPQHGLWGDGVALIALEHT